MKRKYKVSKTTLTSQWVTKRGRSDVGAEWLKHYDCKNCGLELSTHFIKDFHFCPNCGAKIVPKKTKKQ